MFFFKETDRVQKSLCKSLDEKKTFSNKKRKYNQHLFICLFHFVHFHLIELHLLLFTNWVVYWVPVLHGNRKTSFYRCEYKSVNKFTNRYSCRVSLMKCFLFCFLSLQCGAILKMMPMANISNTYFILIVLSFVCVNGVVNNKQFRLKATTIRGFFSFLIFIK